MTSKTKSVPPLQLPLSILLLICCSGCTSVSDNGTMATYGYAAWVPLSIALVGLAAIGWGYLSLYRESDDDENSPYAKGVCWILGGVVGLLLVAPTFAVASVKVGTDKTVIGGSMLWFVPSSTVIDYSRVNEIRTEVKERWTRRGKRKSETLVIGYSDGKSERMSQSVVMTAALPRVISAIENHRRGGNPGMMAGNPQMPGAGAMGNPAGMNPAVAMNPNANLDAMQTAIAPNGPMPSVPPASQGNTTRALPANNSPAPGQPVGATTVLQVGTNISGQAADGKWYPSRITEVLADGTVKIHYEGFPDTFDEVIPRVRARITESVPGSQPAANASLPMELATTPVTSPPQPTVPMLTTPADPGLPPGIAPPANTIEVTASNLKVGQTARAIWGATWYNVKILQVLPDNKAKIHYEGYADSFDEVVVLSKLRLPK